MRVIVFASIIAILAFQNCSAGGGQEGSITSASNSNTGNTGADGSTTGNPDPTGNPGPSISGSFTLSCPLISAIGGSVTCTLTITGTIADISWKVNDVENTTCAGRTSCAISTPALASYSVVARARTSSDVITNQIANISSSVGNKIGNNGTVTCDTYCGNTQWGGFAASCTWAQLKEYDINAIAVDASQTTFVNETCTCQDSAGTFIKIGNNGTVSCNTYCAGAQWGGRVGTAVSAKMEVPCNFLFGGQLLNWSTTADRSLMCGCGTTKPQL